MEYNQLLINQFFMLNIECMRMYAYQRHLGVLFQF